MTNPWRTIAAALAAAVLAACRSGAEEAEGAAIRLTDVDTLVSAASEQLGLPVDLAVDAQGRLWVADAAMHQIVRIDPGGTLSRFGSRGRGPGEYMEPLAVGVWMNGVGVDDRGNGRVVGLDASGAITSTFPVPPGLPGQMAFGPSGVTAIATLGFAPEGLVRVLDNTGEPVHFLADPVVASPPIWNFTAMKEDVRRGRVPDALRNQAAPVIGADGGVWVVLSAEGEVRRFRPDGTLLWSRPVSTPEVQSVREEFFARNRAESNPAAFHGLQYFADAAAVREELWLLVWTENDTPSSIIVLSPTGEVSRRYILPGVQGARSLAIDEPRRRIYLAVPGEAAVLAVGLPG